MRYESEHKPKIRERIVKEAAKAIRAKGPLQVSVAGVMSKAGLTLERCPDRSGDRTDV